MISDLPNPQRVWIRLALVGHQPEINNLVINQVHKNPLGYNGEDTVDPQKRDLCKVPYRDVSKPEKNQLCR